MAKYTLDDFFAARHDGNFYDLRKAIVACATHRDMIFRNAFHKAMTLWQPRDCYHQTLRELALSNPERLTPGQRNPNITRTRKELEDFIYGRWQPMPPIRVSHNVTQW